MPTLVATVSGASSNSYDTVANADTYFTERLQSTAWSGEDTDDKERALIMATRRLDQEKYQGEAATDGQALKWPRLLATNDDGVEFASDAIPTIVKHATFELALRLLVDDDGSTDTFADTGLEQFEDTAVGSLRAKPRTSFRAGQLPAHVKRMLRPVLRTPALSGTMERA